MNSEHLSLPYQIACLILTGLFFFAFSVAREPRGWRRLFQSMFSKSGDFSVNKNKAIDETLKKYGILIAMVILVSDVSIFVWGLTAAQRELDRSLDPTGRAQLNELGNIKAASGGSFRRPAGP